MKLRTIASALLIVLLSAGTSSIAGAAPWRGHYRGGYWPHPIVRVVAPRVFIPPVPVPVVVGGGYYGGGYYGGHPYYGHGYYGHGYGGHYAHGYYGHRGGYRR